VNTNESNARWRYGLAVAIVMVFIALLPQVHFAIYRGRNWHGANAITHPDEVAYSAYVASLIRGNPRRYDPYTGRGAEAGAAESLFSIQVIPAYAIALPGRWLGVSASTLFILFSPLCALASSLTMFWFLRMLTRDARLAAAGLIFIFCFGTLIATQGLISYLLNLNFLIPLWVSEHIPSPSLYHLPFLRLYQPAVAFPLFFMLGAFVWRALNETSGSRSARYAISGGVTLAALVFSYFFLWTAAVAWLVCIALAWLTFRRVEFKRLIMAFAIICGVALPAIIIYFILLSHRALTVDSVQALVPTHRTDLFRLPEAASFIALLLMTLGVKRRLFQAREPQLLFAASLALTVFVVFNQQVITGRSLQPIHYEWFIGNYCALAALVLTAGLWRRNQFRNRSLVIVTAFALAWGVGEVALAASVGWQRNLANDEFRPVAARLAALARSEPASTATVLVSDLPLADRLPTDAPQPLLWAPRMLVFPGVSDVEDHERFFRQLYYLGYDQTMIWSALEKRDWNFYVGFFSYARISPVVTGNASPITPDEINAQINDYLNYANSFDRSRAASPALSYVVVPSSEHIDWQNLDRWYQRDTGERIGDFILYRVTLR
jgi:hypothetical protein